MKPFRFTLEAVGTLRRRQEQKAMEQYARTLLARQQAADALETVRRDLGTCWEEWRRQVAGEFSAADAARTQTCQRVLVQRRDECTQALEGAERRVNAALQCMLQARQQREIVDKCFDKQKARYAREVARGEQKFLDELAGSRRRHSILSWKSTETSL